MARKGDGVSAEHDAEGMALCLCLGVNSTRRLERRIQEDLAFRYLAGGSAAGPQDAE